MELYHWSFDTENFRNFINLGIIENFLIFAKVANPNINIDRLPVSITVLFSDHSNYGGGLKPP
jgi:hypothetical protein